MKNTIINLTPPIDVVQYGYNSEPIKYGDWYISNIETIEQAPFNFKEGLRKVICSTNPKDLRFPYLQLPSKEQEIITLAKDYVMRKYSHKTDKEQLFCYKHIESFIAGFNANPAKYTQEQMEKAIDNAHSAGVMFSSMRTAQKDVEIFKKDYFQSLQPTAKAVRVEMDFFDEEKSMMNNCIVGERIKVEQSAEYSQGLVKALEVIY